jgi:thiol:disulfide interchange protein DsbA
MKTVILTVIASLASLTLTATAVAAEEYEVGVHYEALPIAVETADASRIEVVEVFSYGCVHCFSFDPTIEAWRARLPADVAFRRVPAMFRQDWVILAQAYYAAEALGVVDKVHGALFEAIHLKNLDYRNPDNIARVFKEAAGVDPAEFIRVLNSFGVRSKTQQADAQGRMYRLSGVPSLVVDGKYRVYGGKIDGSNTSMLGVVDYLTAKIRTEKAN